MPAQKTYFGIDMDSGVVGIAALYAVQASIKQREFCLRPRQLSLGSILIVNLS